MHSGKHSGKENENVKVERVQTGIRIEKKMLKVLKALAEYLDISLGDLLEALFCMHLRIKHHLTTVIYGELLR